MWSQYSTTPVNGAEKREKKKEKEKKEKEKKEKMLVLVSLFNGISTFVGYTEKEEWKIK